MFGNRNIFSSISRSLIVAVLFAMSAYTTQAALKDSDVDGITDEAETATYHTDPQKSDTDGDGFDDGYEVVNHIDPLDAKSTPFAIPETSSATVRIAHSISNTWLLGMLGGMVGVVLISVILLRRFRAQTESDGMTLASTSPKPPIVQ